MSASKPVVLADRQNGNIQASFLSQMGIGMNDTTPSMLKQSLAPDIKESRYNRDVGIGNNYKIECIKHSMTMATGALVFTITFKKDFEQNGFDSLFQKSILSFGWFLLIISLAFGIWHMQCWEQYYFSWIKEHEGRQQERRRLTGIWYRRASIARVVQYSSLSIGLLMIVLYVVVGIWTNAPVRNS